MKPSSNELNIENLKKLEKRLDENPNDSEAINKIKTIINEENLNILPYDEKYYMSWIDKITGVKDNMECPCCGGKVVPVVYGYPSPELMEKERRGEVALGGCCIGLLDPDYFCRSCSQFLFKPICRIEIDTDDENVGKYIIDSLGLINYAVEMKIPKRELKNGFMQFDKREMNALVDRLIEIGYLAKTRKRYYEYGLKR